MEDALREEGKVFDVVSGCFGENRGTLHLAHGTDEPKYKRAGDLEIV
jgi:hypothetical protein